MYCSTCGRQVAPDARFCDNCGAAITDQQAGGPQYAPGMPYQSQAGYGTPVDIPNYLVQAIIVTICCCLPAGIVAIVFAAQVNGKVDAGDYEGALRYSRNARTWCWVSFGLGIAVTLIYGAFAALGVLSEFMWLL